MGGKAKPQQIDETDEDHAKRKKRNKQRQESQARTRAAEKEKKAAEQAAKQAKTDRRREQDRKRKRNKKMSSSKSSTQPPTTPIRSHPGVDNALAVFTEQVGNGKVDPDHVLRMAEIAVQPEAAGRNAEVAEHNAVAAEHNAVAAEHNAVAAEHTARSDLFRWEKSKSDRDVVREINATPDSKISTVNAYFSQPPPDLDFHGAFSPSAETTTTTGLESVSPKKRSGTLGTSPLAAPKTAPPNKSKSMFDPIIENPNEEDDGNDDEDEMGVENIENIKADLFNMTLSPKKLSVEEKEEDQRMKEKYDGSHDENHDEKQDARMDTNQNLVSFKIPTKPTSTETIVLSPSSGKTPSPLPISTSPSASASAPSAGKTSQGLSASSTGTIVLSPSSGKTPSPLPNSTSPSASAPSAGKTSQGLSASSSTTNVSSTAVSSSSGTPPKLTLENKPCSFCEHLGTCLVHGKTAPGLTLKLAPGWTLAPASASLWALADRLAKNGFVCVYEEIVTDSKGKPVLNWIKLSEQAQNNVETIWNHGLASVESISDATKPHHVEQRTHIATSDKRRAIVPDCFLEYLEEFEQKALEDPVKASKTLDGLVQKHKGDLPEDFIIRRELPSLKRAVEKGFELKREASKLSFRFACLRVFF